MSRYGLLFKNPDDPIDASALKRMAEMAQFHHGGTIKQLRPGIFRLGCDADDYIAIDSRVLDPVRLEAIAKYRDHELHHIMYDASPTRPLEARRLELAPHPDHASMRPIDKGPCTAILFAQGPARALPLIILGIFIPRYSEKKAWADLEAHYGMSKHAQLKLRSLLQGLPPLPDTRTTTCLSSKALSTATG